MVVTDSIWRVRAELGRQQEEETNGKGKQPDERWRAMETKARTPPPPRTFV